MDLQSLQDGIHAWASSKLPAGVSAVWARQNAPRPAKPYLTLSINVLTKIGEDYRHAPSAAEKVRIVGNRELTLSINGYGDGAIQLVSDLVDSLEDEVAHDSLRTDGLVFVDREAVNDLTGLVADGSSFEERGQVDVRFRVVRDTVHNMAVGVIESVVGPIGQAN